jgi:hypothetical protein
MPKRNEFYGFEIIQAMNARKRQKRWTILHIAAWWAIWIIVGFGVGYALIHMGY